MFAIRKSPFGIVNIIHSIVRNVFLNFYILDHVTLYVYTMYNVQTHTFENTLTLNGQKNTEKL